MSQPLPLSRQLALSAISFGKSFLWTSSEYFLLVYLVAVVGLLPLVAGAWLFASLVFAAALDPLIGAILDRYRDRFGKFSDIVVFGAAASSLSYMFLFTAPASLTGTAATSAAAFGLVAFRIGYALLDLPHNSLLALVPATPAIRTDLAAQRQIFGSLAGLILSSALGAALIRGQNGVDLGLLQVVAVCLAVASFAIVLACARFVRAYEVPAAAIAGANRNTRDIFAALIVSPQYIGLLCITFVTHVTVPAFSKSASFLELEVGSLFPGATLVAMTTAHAATAFLWSRFSSRVGKSIGAMFAFAWTALAATVFGFVLLTAASDLALVLAGAAMGVGSAGVFTLIWSLAPDAVDAANQGKDINLHGTAFGVFTFFNKAALGLSAALVGVLLQAGPSTSASAWAAFAPPAIGGLLGAALMLVWPRLKSTRKEL